MAICSSFDLRAHHVRPGGGDPPVLGDAQRGDAGQHDRRDDLQPSGRRRRTPPNRIAFIGTTHVDANRDGLRYFMRDVFPLVREEVPDLEVDIVGGEPPPDIRAFDSLPGVTVTGFVDDVRDYMARATALDRPPAQRGRYPPRRSSRDSASACRPSPARSAPRAWTSSTASTSCWPTTRRRSRPLWSRAARPRAAGAAQRRRPPRRRGALRLALAGPALPGPPAVGTRRPERRPAGMTPGPQRAH